MNSISELKDVLAARRRAGFGVTGGNTEKLALHEVRKTTFKHDRGVLVLSDHLRDVNHAKTMSLIYRAFENQMLVPARHLLLSLIKAGKTRIEFLEDMIKELEKNPSRIYGLVINEEDFDAHKDIIQWKLLYYRQTVEDCQEMLQIHDEDMLFLDRPYNFSDDSGGFQNFYH